MSLGLAPHAGVGDGTLDLALVGKVSRCKNLKIMRTVSLHGGKGLLPSQNSKLQVYRVDRWSFTPISLRKDDPEDIGRGSWNVDGEILPQGPKTLNFK